MRSATPYQVEILKLVLAGNPDGEGLVDFDQVLERLSWKPTKQAAQFSIRAVIEKGLIEKRPVETRRSRRRVTFAITDSGMRTLDPRDHAPGTSPIVPEIDFGDPFSDRDLTF